MKRIYQITLCLCFFISCLFFRPILAKALDQVQWQAKPGTVSLTFDDGPNPTFTPEILKILKENHIPATFFVVGWSAKKHPELLKQIIAEGHAIGSHSMSHPMLTRLSQEKLSFEVIETSKIIQNIIGTPPVCLRPPYGMGNPRVGAFIRSQGMIMVPMGFNSFDYERRGVNTLVNWVVKNAVSGRVILLHDGYAKREQTVQALPLIIEGIRKKGLGFSQICQP